MADAMTAAAEPRPADAPPLGGGLRGFWYIAAPTTRLAAAPAASRVLDQDLVLFRGADGHPHALLDRCCHRGVRLSLGKVAGDSLACRYHGWQFDGEGRCVHIPSLAAGQTIKKGTEVPAFPCLEQDGYVWVWMAPETPPPAPAPRIPGYEGHRWTQGTMPIACAAIAGIENNLDWCHAAFTHPWSHPQFFKTRFTGLREESFEVRLTETGLVMFGPPTAEAGDPVPERVVRIHFVLPDRIVFALPGAASTIVLHFVSTGAASCRMEWLARATAPIGPRLRWNGRTPRVFAQDRDVLESAEGWYGRVGHGFERSVEADGPGLLLRRIMALAAAGDWESGRNALPQRRVLTVRA
jgi:phenylpropionate dioxygenase-like ring-hydroxylating dioxygenase large terminal subunit